ncbi:MAG: hypothetical protein VB084_12235 [Syntrophomonadaceae bacterium]|nr:hypothetical protein [Syntrophomonadaceae bacterium]
MKSSTAYEFVRLVLGISRRVFYFFGFSLDKVKEDIAQINPSAAVFMVSGRTGEGIEAWNEWLLEEVKKKNLNK